jgi:1-deoxy-D-xylulose-5-phosphate synthase
VAKVSAKLAAMPTLSATSPEQLRKLSVNQLPDFCKEVARFVLGATAEKEGHIVSSLAVTELTVALHYAFNTPSDILIWDVGHQAYIHKALTGRSEQFKTNRQKGGISGFTARGESIFDPFGAGHSSTSISAIGGFAQAARLQNVKRKHIAVIGDGAITGGMAFEALNHLGTLNLDILLILNDNEESIDTNIGGLHEFQSYKDFFESLGWGYQGPVNDHDIVNLVRIFEKEKLREGTRVLHLKTKKQPISFWRKLFEVDAPSQPKQSDFIAYQDIFVNALIDLANADSRIVAISPAMLSGSSLTVFKGKFPNRTYDVGIAEQHAVTFAAGLAASGLKPLVHLYSTFAQRGYDQIIHDVALQNLPVVFVLDRAGLVGEDGATHHGAFDLAFLNPIPNLQILAPMDGAELKSMLAYAFAKNSPVVIRYPRGGEQHKSTEVYAIKTSSFRILKDGEKVVVVSLGTIGKMVQQAVQDLPVGHIDLRFLKPWDDGALEAALQPYQYIISIEDGNMRGGLRDSLATWLMQHAPAKKLYGMGLPDHFIQHGSIKELNQELGFNEEALQKLLNQLIGC